MFHNDNGRQATARGKLGRQGNTARLDFGHEIVQNTVRHILIENTFIAKLLKIQFETLQLDAFFIGDIAKSQDPKIGVARFGTNRSKLGAFDFNGVISIGKLVVKRFEILTELGWHVLPLA